MSIKNILSDTDFTRGKDTRFQTAVLIGRVSKIECTDKHANVRVIMPDRKDHNGTPLNTKPVPVLQIASMAKKQFAVPRLNDLVVMVKMANSTSDYLVVGSIYSKSNPPPVKDPLLDYTAWEGGHTQQFDANKDADVFLTQDFKGGWKGTYKKDVNLATTDSAQFNVKADGDMLLQSANGNIDVKAPSGTITLEQDTIILKGTSGITLQGPVTIIGNITHTGGMVTSGAHLDVNGHHTGAAARDVLLARIEALEARVTALEGAPRQ